MIVNSRYEPSRLRSPRRDKSESDRKAVLGVFNTVLDIILKTSAISVVLGGLIVKRYLNQMGFGYLFPTILGSQGALLAIVFSLGLIIFAISTTWFVSPWCAILSKDMAMKARLPTTLFESRPLIGLYVATPVVIVAFICSLWENWVVPCVFFAPLAMTLLWLWRDVETMAVVRSLLEIKEKSLSQTIDVNSAGKLHRASRWFWALLHRVYNLPRIGMHTARLQIMKWYTNAGDFYAISALLLIIALVVSAPLYIFPRVPAWREMLCSMVNNWTPPEQLLAGVLSVSIFCSVFEAAFSIGPCRFICEWLAKPILIVRSWSEQELKSAFALIALIFLTYCATVCSIFPWVFLFQIVHAELLARADPSYLNAWEVGILTVWNLAFGAISGWLAATINTQDKKKRAAGITVMAMVFGFLTFILIMVAPNSIFQAAMYASGIRENSNEAHCYAVEKEAYEKLMPGENRIPSRGFGLSKSHYICAYSPFVYSDKKILCAPSVLQPSVDQCVAMTETEARIVLRPVNIVALPDDKFCQRKESKK